MEGILKNIEFIEDIRQQAKVRHKLLDVIVILLFAKLANADDWEEMEAFAECHEDFLRQYIALENGIPSHDTLQRVMGNIDPQHMQKLYEKWNALLNTDEGEKLKKIICIDGKTMRGNGNRNQKPSHIVSAWSDEDGFCLGQKAAGEKSNEITAIPQQTAIAEKIRFKRADYVLAVKENQKNLYAEISEYFEDEEFLKEIKNGAGYKKTQEKSYFRTEIREYY